MSFDVKKVGVFSRRAFIVTVLKLLAFFIIFGRLFHLQVFSHKKYLDKSTNNHTKSFVIPPKRGMIFDINGERIAYNAKYWRVVFKGKKKNFSVVQNVLNILEVSQVQQEYILEQYKKNPFEEFVIYEFLSQSQLTNIEINIPSLPGIYAVEGVARYYKNDIAYSNIIGYVRTPTFDDIQKGRSEHPDIKIGATGLERVYNKALTGIQGYKIVETNAFGHKISDLSTQDPKSGEDITLTLDSRVQEFMALLSNGEKMSSVLMDVRTGNILGMVSSPMFNSEKLSQKISQDEWQEIAKDPQKPMFNRSYQAQYPPGSVFKIIVALAALENGFNPNKQFYCNGKHKIGRQVFRCWKPQGHGKVNLHNAIKYSCNVYFYNFADYITSSNIKDVAVKLGLNQIYSSLPLVGQATGLVPDEDWASAVKKFWYKGDLVNTIIGQGSVSCTTLQLATMISRIAFEKKVDPCMEIKNNAFDSLSVSGENLLILKSALFDGSNTPGGTSFGGRIAEEGFQFAGKTGTAQVVSKYVRLGDEYKIEYEKPHGLFAGFAPFHDPKFAIATIYENGGYGASSALPFSRKLLYYIQKLYAGQIEEAEKFRQQFNIQK